MSSASVVALAAAFLLALATFLLALKARRARFVRFVLLGFAGVWLSVASLFCTTDMASNRDELRQAAFGWPLRFVVQNHERFDPPFPVPVRIQWELSSNDPSHPARRVLWVRFFGCIAFYSILLFGLSRSARR